MTLMDYHYVLELFLILIIKQFSIFTILETRIFPDITNAQNKYLQSSMNDYTFIEVNFVNFHTFTNCL